MQKPLEHSRTVNPCNSWTLVPLPRMIYGLGNDNCDLLQIWSHPGKRQSLRSSPDISVRTSGHMHMPTFIVYCLAHPPLGSFAGKDSRPVADVVRSTSHGSLPWPTYSSLEFMLHVRTLGICGPQQECTHPNCSVWAISVGLATKWSINKRKRKGSPPWHQIILKLMLLKN